MISKAHREPLKLRDRTHGLEKFWHLEHAAVTWVCGLVRVSVGMPVTRALVLGHLFFVLAYLLLHFAEGRIQGGKDGIRLGKGNEIRSVLR
jgi:hypothetical protein